ncbi:hypothetical protein ACHAQA_006694 [Verticillium albo-atrum]
MCEEVPIPEPAGLPILGNIRNIDKEFPLGSMVSLSDQFGEIYRMRFPGRTIVFVSTHKLVNETCDEKRFRKCINDVLSNVRNGVHDGLFTAEEGEVNWGIAHRVLMPAFGPLSIRGMFDEMHDIASQLVLKWARHGPDAPIMVTDDFTRLTLDTLALCSMGFRFNSFYSPDMHPFIEAMGDFLTESGRIANRLPLPSLFYRATDLKYKEDIKTLRTTAKDVLESRKAGSGSDRRDLLTAMLNGTDPKTGAHMAYYKAQKEIDEAIGKGTIRVEHMSKLPYMNGVLREALRVNATIPLFSVEAREDTLLGGKYAVSQGEVILNVLAKSHLDPLVYGDDAHEFKPERMLDAEFEKRGRQFPNCWKPFGNGVRACIGRPTSIFVLDPNYVHGVKQTLTIKPKNLHMRAILREGLTPTFLERRLAGLPAGEPNASVHGTATGVGDETSGIPITVLYGSNSGTCESLSQRIASDASSHGFHAAKVDCLDSANDKLPTDHPVVIVTASYEGQPPDNAGHFVSWVEGLAESDQQAALKDVSYAVYGCGNRDWVQTFHRIPKLVDSLLEKAGATRVADMGLTDVSSGEVFTDFETWEDQILWPALKKKYGRQESGQATGHNPKRVNVTLSTPRTATLRQDVKEATVIAEKVLTSGNRYNGAKKHLEMKLPEGITYKSGDYLAVLPINPKENVHRVFRRFKLSRDAHLNISADGSTTLPVNEDISAYDVLSSLLTLVDYTKDDTTKAELARLAGDAYAEEIIEKRTSILDVLERHPTSIDVPIGIFLALLPAMRVRQYSISSSPLYDPSRATVTFSVIGGKPALSGTGHQYMGVASSFLGSLGPGDTLQVAVRPPPGAHFRLPPDASSTPIICIAAGTGLAPFRAFIEERAVMLAAGRTNLAPALLFFGCRSPDQDDLYREELDTWQSLGAVDVRRAYSEAPEKSNKCKHVQDRMWADRSDLIDLWRKDAKVYICGSRGLANSARDMAVKLRLELMKLKGQQADGEMAEKWLESLRNVRYVMDVFD